MQKHILILILLLITTLSTAQEQPNNGLITQQSIHDLTTTHEKLESAIAEAGLTLMTVVDHQANAASVNLELRPTRLFIFGNPNAGTPLMQNAQSMAIDLPQKMLIWEDDAGVVFVTYNDPMYLAQRHGVTGMDEALTKISGVLASLATSATSE